MLDLLCFLGEIALLEVPEMRSDVVGEKACLDVDDFFHVFLHFREDV